MPKGIKFSKRLRARFMSYGMVALGAISSVAMPRMALADEGGVSFWLPGLFGSLAATPAQPGMSWATIYYHTSVDAGGERNFTRGTRVVAGLNGQGDLALFLPTYVFSTPVLGAQAAVSLLGVGGRNQASINATLTGPLGNTISGSRSEAVTGFGDLIPQFNLRWNQGVHNLMTYVTGDIPVGDYNPNRIVNIGIGHGAIDGGAAYTYFNPQAGNEFSITTGLTYNFKNTDTQYQNGVDMHFDWGASHFMTKQLQIGVVGYLYQQITGDSGSGAVLGPFESRVASIGPQIGFLFPVNDLQGYINVKAYKEFAAQNRPEGWNTWLTFAISPAAPDKSPTTPTKPLTRKY
jgi:hypothetical protein